jgi:hypothetical protein
MILTPTIAYCGIISSVTVFADVVTHALSPASCDAIAIDYDQTCRIRLAAGAGIVIRVQAIADC